MKHLILALIFLVMLGVAAVVTLRMLKPEGDPSVENAARLFFYQLANDRVYDAYRSSTSRVQNTQFSKFEKSLKIFGLTAGVEVRFDPPLIGPNEATIHCAFQDSEGTTLNVTLNMVRQNSQWKVYSILSDQSGDVLNLSRNSRVAENLQPTATEATPDKTTPASGSEMPTEERIQSLVRRTLMAFNEAVQLRYFALFYQQISQAWQQQTTQSKLTEAFKGFMDKKVSFPEIANMQAEFSEPPTINANGMLEVNGSYAHPRYKIRFYLRYTYEQSKWRLFGIDIDLVRSEISAP